MSENIIVESRGRVGLIRLNRPQALNALNSAVIRELAEAIDTFEADDKIGCMVITGSDKAFAAGADIKELAGKTFTEAFLSDFLATWHRVADARKPVIAAVNGFAFGGGFELALVCDLIVASERAQFGLPEPTLGLVPGGGGTQRLPRIVGQHRAKEILLTGRRLNALEAYEWGIVTAVTPAHDEIRMALELGEKIARQAPLAIQALKRLVNEGVNAPLETALSYEQQTLLSLYTTDDGQEGINAFMEKRPAVFHGK